MPYEDKCIKYSDEKCLRCEIKNGKEECTRCIKGYTAKEGKCQECSLEFCVDCYFYEGKEKCSECKEGYGKEAGKCFDCKILDNKCKYCSSGYYIVGKNICFSCVMERDNTLYKTEQCSLICSDKNCLKCSLIGDVELCDKCKDGYMVGNDYYNFRKCVAKYDYPYYWSSKYHCIKCSISGKCVECYDNYYIDDYGKCKEKKNSDKSGLPTLISIVFFVIIVITAYCREKDRRCNLPNQRRVNQNNLNNINNNMNNNNITVNLNRSNPNEQRISGNVIILKDNELSNEFNRLKIKFENKLCHFCKSENSKYIGDCGCIVCQKHSNFKEVINDEGKFKICYNCGKTIKDLKLIKTN